MIDDGVLVFSIAIVFCAYGLTLWYRSLKKVVDCPND